MNNPYISKKEAEEKFDKEFGLVGYTKTTNDYQAWYPYPEAGQEIKTLVHSLRHSDIQSHIEKAESMKMPNNDFEPNKIYNNAINDVVLYLKSLTLEE